MADRGSLYRQLGHFGFPFNGPPIDSDKYRARARNLPFFPSLSFLSLSLSFSVSLSQENDPSRRARSLRGENVENDTLPTLRDLQKTNTRSVERRFVKVSRGNCARDR